MVLLLIFMIARPQPRRRNVTRTNSEMQSSLQSGYAQAHVCCLGRGHIHLNNSTDLTGYLAVPTFTESFSSSRLFGTLLQICIV